MACVLVIDDDAISRGMMVCALERSGFEVVEACDGIEGVEVARSRHIDIVVTDIFMPEQDGLRTIMEIRRDFPDLKIIAVSGGGAVVPTNYLPVAETLGANGVLTKPIMPPDLINAVKTLLAS